MAHKEYYSEVRDLLKAFGERVQLARMRRRWSQADLAERMSVERRTVSRLEKGDPGVGLGAFLAALWLLDLWETAKDVALPSADKIGAFMEKQRTPARARRRKEKELDF